MLLPVRARCTQCGTEWEGDGPPAGCPTCGAVDMESTGGDELLLESIEYQA